MKTSVVPIGNSKGVRLPKALLELCQIESAVDLSVKGQTIVIRPMKRRPRAGWDATFKRMHEHHEDRLLIEEGIDLAIGPWEW